MEAIICSVNKEEKLGYPSDSGLHLMESFSKMTPASFFSWDQQIMRGRERIPFKSTESKYFDQISIVSNFF